MACLLKLGHPVYYFFSFVRAVLEYNYASIVEIVANVTKEVILVGEILTSIG